MRNGEQTGAFSRDMETAIGSASSLAAKEPDQETTVWLSLKGKQKKVWPD
jgi:hypothetical protein